jgi:hypothetical protein
MNAAVMKRLALIPVMVMLMAATLLVDPAPIDAPASLNHKEVVDVVRKTLISRDWLLIKDAEGVIDAKLDLRTHSLTVRYTVTDRRISFKYLDSVNLDYRVDHSGHPRIHRKYAGWMANVVTALNKDLQLAALAKSG